MGIWCIPARDGVVRSKVKTIYVARVKTARELVQYGQKSQQAEMDPTLLSEDSQG